ncbi:MAG: SHD1 domain-containing protein [Thermoguttaceae bacterium]
MFKRSVILCVAVALLFSFGRVAEAQTKVNTSKSKTRGLTKNQPRIGDEGNWPSVGKVGQIRYCKFKVVQVVDEQNVLGEITLDERPRIVAITRSGPDAPSHADTVGGPKQSIVWFNMPTKGMVDDSDFKTEEIFTVTGTKQYEAASGGTKTVFILKMRTQADVQAEQQAAAQELQKKKKLAAENRAAAEAKLKAEREKRAKEDTRIWTAASGGKTLKATFAGCIADKVKLKKEDGTVITVTKDQLSDEDQAWIKNRSKH